MVSESHHSFEASATENSKHVDTRVHQVLCEAIPAAFAGALEASL